MPERLGQELVPDGLWAIVEPLLPPQRERPQGGGTRYVDDRAVFTAIVYVLTTGCAWRHLPAEFGVRSEEHTTELQSRQYLVCRLLLEKKTKGTTSPPTRTARATDAAAPTV